MLYVCLRGVMDVCFCLYCDARSCSWGLIKQVVLGLTEGIGSYIGSIMHVYSIIICRFSPPLECCSGQP